MILGVRWQSELMAQGALVEREFNGLTTSVAEIYLRGRIVKTAFRSPTGHSIRQLVSKHLGQHFAPCTHAESCLSDTAYCMCGSLLLELPPLLLRCGIIESVPETGT